MRGWWGCRVQKLDSKASAKANFIATSDTTAPPAWGPRTSSPHCGPWACFWCCCMAGGDSVGGRGRVPLARRVELLAALRGAARAALSRAQLPPTQQLLGLAVPRAHGLEMVLPCLRARLQAGSEAKRAGSRAVRDSARRQRARRRWLALLPGLSVLPTLRRAACLACCMCV